MRRSKSAYQPAGRTPPVGHNGIGTAFRSTLVAGLLGATVLAGCSGSTIKHGHHFQPSDVQQIQPGMSQDQVRLTLGTPETTATVGGGRAYYYISSTTKQMAFLKPTEVDRQVVAIYFNPLGSVERVANYGLKDGKVFDFISRKTPAPGGKDVGLINQLFRNLGKGQQKLFDPGKIP